MVLFFRLAVTLLFSLATINNCYSMIFDNRFFPLYQKPFFKFRSISSCFESPSALVVQPIATTATCSTDDFGDKAPISAFEGKFDEAIEAKALKVAGIITDNDPLFRSDIIGIASIPWRFTGKLESLGVALLYEQAITKHFAVGFSAIFLRVESHREFKREKKDVINGDVRPGDERELINLRAKMTHLLGLTPPQFSQVGFGDLDLYLRFGNIWEYRARMKQIIAGLRLGMYAPTGLRRELDNPASVPFGGNGFWGAYLQLENEFELKEDLRVGFQFRLIKRFSRDFVNRFSVCSEPEIFGAGCGPMKITPGLTYVFNPYVSIEGLREGLGLRVLYTLVKHERDVFCDLRDKTKPIALLNSTEKRSSWGMEHVTVSAFYDFGKAREDRKLLPVVSLAWDIPISFLVAKRSVRSNGISVLIEMDF